MNILSVAGLMVDTIWNMIPVQFQHMAQMAELRTK